MIQSPVRMLWYFGRNDWAVTRVHAFPAVPRMDPVDWQVRVGLDRQPRLLHARVRSRIASVPSK